MYRRICRFTLCDVCARRCVCGGMGCRCHQLANDPSCRVCGDNCCPAAHMMHHHLRRRRRRRCRRRRHQCRSRDSYSCRVHRRWAHESLRRGSGWWRHAGRRSWCIGCRRHRPPPPPQLWSSRSAALMVIGVWAAMCVVPPRPLVWLLLAPRCPMVALRREGRPRRARRGWEQAGHCIAPVCARPRAPHTCDTPAVCRRLWRMHVARR